jgi:hypothetical protein
MINKSDQEVTKIFIEKASYILRATIQEKNNISKKSSKNIKASTKPLWDPKKIEVNDFFSSISYLKVIKIEGTQVTVNNSNGGSWLISKDLLVRDMWSADHFDKEVKCTMTDLS